MIKSMSMIVLDERGYETTLSVRKNGDMVTLNGVGGQSLNLNQTLTLIEALHLRKMLNEVLA